ncbi:helix-turn-helix domain-containing protein [uncultured Hydrogenophaga sp.]|uniref:IclR family transcriptional regulator n=1 Tax=uncultured Hydrogenophaga sp. TaxID=199683 RepID=UPI00259014EB|nr:helix-turn-helix domain-containing protein [uncultured Hydrogenophaga sp.]
MADSQVKSAARALQVLEYFEHVQRPAGVQEIARALQYPVSSTSVLIKTLSELGYLNRHPDSQKFAPTMRQPLLGGWIRAGRADGHALAELVREAKRATGLSAVLSSRHGQHVQYIYVQLAEARDFVSRSPHSGTLRTICRCAAGIAMLTNESDDRIALLARTTAATEKRAIDLDLLMERVVEARAAGYAWQADSNLPGVGDVAVLLNEIDPFGKALILSVGAASNAIRTRHHELGGYLKRLITEFSAGLPPATLDGSVSAE